MKLIPKPLSVEGFAPYGSYAKVSDHDGDPSSPMCYVPDCAAVKLSCDAVSIGVLHVDPQEPLMTAMEMHEHTEEGWIVLNGDCVACFGLPAADPNDTSYEAFTFEAGTVVSLKAGVWHYAPFASGKARTAVLALLPPNTPENDLIMKELSEPIVIA